MPLLHVFDLDGTLFDTYEATKYTYEQAGLPEYKKEYYGKTAKAWGCPPEIHEKKKILFSKYSGELNQAWAMPYYKTFLPSAAFILTGASQETVDTCRRAFPRIELRNPYGYGLDLKEKRRVLKVLSYHLGYDVFYYDDIPEIGLEIVSGLHGVRLITEGDLP